jgi:hypothetical protein
LRHHSHAVVVVRRFVRFVDAPLGRERRFRGADQERRDEGRRDDHLDGARRRKKTTQLESSSEKRLAGGKVWGRRDGE